MPRETRRATSILVVAAILAIAGCAHAEETRPRLDFVLDPARSQEGGVRSVESLSRLLYRYEVALDDVDPGSPVIDAAGRAAKSLFLDLPIAQLTATTTHEVFGHGARARESGIDVDYNFRLPEPYGSIVGRAPDYQGITLPSGPIAGDARILFTLGGMEANYRTAELVHLHAAKHDGWLHHGELLVLAASKLTYSSTYISPGLRRGDPGDAANDVHEYVARLQDRSNRVAPADRASIGRQLQIAYLWNLADPALLYAVYAEAYLAILRGERYAKAPLLHVRGLTLHAAPRFDPSPWGAEQGIDVFVARDGWALEISPHVGTSRLAIYDGIDVRAVDVPIARRLRASCDLDLFYQPEISTERAYYDRKSRAGVSAAGHLRVDLAWGLGLYGMLGYKTEGYVRSQPLAAGAFGFAGLSMREP